MPAIPTTISLNKSTMNKDQFHTWMLDLHAYLTGVIASTGTAADARAQLGLGTAATKNTGVATGEVPLVGTKSATELLAGTVELATTAEAQAGTDDTVVMTSLKTAQAMKGANQSLAANGYQKLPGGLIIQWGTFSLAAAAASTQAITFPVAFPTALIHPSVSVDNSSNDMIGTISRSLTGMTINKGANDTSARTGFWQAIGY